MLPNLFFKSFSKKIECHLEQPFHFSRHCFILLHHDNYQISWETKYIYWTKYLCLAKPVPLGFTLYTMYILRDACVYKWVCISYIASKPWFGFGCKVKPLLVGVQYLNLKMHLLGYYILR
jgi:hypothetical protein